VPAIAAGSRNPVVQALIPVCEQLYERRHNLGAELRQLGRLMFPAFPELLARPRGGAGDFEARRSDGFEAVIRVLLAAAACCDFAGDYRPGAEAMQLRDPAGGFLAVHRLAELAELPADLTAPTETDPRRRRFRMDTAERALRALRCAKILCFTKQHREQLADGRYTSSAPALRKLSVAFFAKIGPGTPKDCAAAHLTRTFLWWRDAKSRRHRKDRRGPTPPAPIDVRAAEALTDIRRGQGRAGPWSVSAPAPNRGTSSTVPPDLLETVHAEHPDWQLPELLAEARRRQAELEPPDGGAGAPPESP
jgi:hypothetical protein